MRWTDIKKKVVVLYDKVKDKTRCIKACYLTFQRKQRNALHKVKAEGQRITVKTVLLNFGELWGLGNRSIFTAIGHLMWRPGYMVSDYLNGKRGVYLQPVKSLVVTTLLVMQMAWMLNIETYQWKSHHVKVEQILQSENDISSEAIQIVLDLVDKFDTYHFWLYDHMVFAILYYSLFTIFLVWLLFRNSPRKMSSEYVSSQKSKANYNIAEITTAMIYFLTQLQILTIIWLLITRSDISSSTQPIWLPIQVHFIVFLIDFKQLFQRSWWGTLWRTAIAVFLV